MPNNSHLRKGSNAKKVWEERFGRVKEGLLVHHKDGNPGNDCIDNLEAVTTKQHAERHKVMGTYKNGSHTITRVYGTEPSDFVSF